MKYLYLGIEFIGTFLLIYIIYYFLIIRKNKKYNPNLVPVEIAMILMHYDIKLNDKSYRKMLRVVSIAISLNLAISVTVLFRMFDNVYLSGFLAIVLMLSLTFVTNNIIGRIFSKKGTK